MNEAMSRSSGLIIGPRNADVNQSTFLLQQKFSQPVFSVKPTPFPFPLPDNPTRPNPTRQDPT
jgi:hypothetical protein